MSNLDKIEGKHRDEGLVSAAKEVPVQDLEFAKEDPYKTTATFAAIALVTSLAAAYFFSPACAAFVGTVGTKAATLVSPTTTAMSAFAVAHPLFASLIVVAAVRALVAVPMLAYKNSDKAAQIKKVVEVLNDDSITDPVTKLNDVKQALGLQPAQGV